VAQTAASAAAAANIPNFMGKSRFPPDVSARYDSTFLDSAAPDHHKAGSAGHQVRVNSFISD
jgi:hypothetical protein